MFIFCPETSKLKILSGITLEIGNSQTRRRKLLTRTPRSSLCARSFGRSHNSGRCSTQESTWISVFILYLMLRLLSGPGKLSWYSDSLLARRSWYRISVLARFSTHVQTGPGAHPLLYNGSLPGVKRPPCGLDHPSLYSAEVKVRGELCLHSPYWNSWPVLGWILSLP